MMTSREYPRRAHHLQTKIRKQKNFTTTSEGKASETKSWHIVCTGLRYGCKAQTRGYRRTRKLCIYLV